MPFGSLVVVDVDVDVDVDVNGDGDDGEVEWHRVVVAACSLQSGGHLLCSPSYFAPTGAMQVALCFQQSRFDERNQSARMQIDVGIF
jgi:hypothetical protein